MLPAWTPGVPTNVTAGALSSLTSIVRGPSKLTRWPDRCAVAPAKPEAAKACVNATATSSGEFSRLIGTACDCGLTTSVKIKFQADRFVSDANGDNIAILDPGTFRQGQHVAQIKFKDHGQRHVAVPEDDEAVAVSQIGARGRDQFVTTGARHRGR